VIVDHQIRFDATTLRAMGTRCQVIITGPDASLLRDVAPARIRALEGLWSRFIPDSDLQRINRANGRPTQVAPETIELLRRCALAWQATGGVWDPTMHDALVHLGYDRPFDQLDGSGSEAGAVASRHRSQGLSNLSFSSTVSVQVDAGVHLDLGGIAKGFAADLISAELMDAGAWGALVNLGGDLRVRGLPPSGLTWSVEIGEAALGANSDVLSRVHLQSGGVATSTSARRRWEAVSGEHHHLLDPVTSLPAESDIALTSVSAGEAWWAEVAATALTVRPELNLPNCSWMQVGHDGAVARSADFADYEYTDAVHRPGGESDG